MNEPNYMMVEPGTCGCKPPRIDLRDYKVCATEEQIYNLPTTFCLKQPQKIKNQGNTNSCVAHAISSIGEYWAYQDQKKYVTLSTEFPYGIQYSECGQDSYGMYLPDACKIVAKYGNMEERDCPGNNEIPYCYKRAEEALKDDNKVSRAYEYRIDRYYNCSTDNDIKYAIYTYGPVLASVKWYQKYFIEENTHQLFFNTNSSFGYHATVILGWNENGFICQNSWGVGWGENGNYCLPYNKSGMTFAEAKAIIDYDNPEESVDPKEDEALIIPEYNIVTNILLKMLNALINLFLKAKVNLSANYNR